MPFPTTPALAGALRAMARSAAEPSAPYRVVRRDGYAVVTRAARASTAVSTTERAAHEAMPATVVAVTVAR